MSATIAPAKKSKKKRSEKYENLVGPTDPKVDLAARERLITARVGLLLRHSFFGNLATRLQLINADEWCGTAATDGRKFYYNSRFIMMLRTKEVEFLVGHEVLHVVYDHMGRRGSRDPQLWNIADDYCVNADLKKHKVGEFITTVPCLYDQKYEGMSAEQVYDDLYEKADKISMDDLLDKMLDDHMEDDGEESDGECDGNNNGDGNSKGKGKRPKMSDAEREEARQEMKQAILAAAQSAEAGSIPKGVERLIKHQTNPVMPGMTPGEEIDVTIAIDMSGSISNTQGQQFLAEVAGMMDAFDGYKVHVFCFDTAVYNPADFTSENLDTIDDYELAGGGGTDFDSIFDYLKSEALVPNRLIVFTDGYPCGSWGDSNYCDTTWIIHGDPEPNPPFGTYAIYNDHKSRG